MRGGWRFAVTRLRSRLTMQAKLGRCPSVRLGEHLLAELLLLRADGRTVAFLKVRVEGIFRVQIHIVQHGGCDLESLVCVCARVRVCTTTTTTTTTKTKKELCTKKKSVLLNLIYRWLRKYPKRCCAKMCTTNPLRLRVGAYRSSLRWVSLQRLLYRRAAPSAPPPHSPAPLRGFPAAWQLGAHTWTQDVTGIPQ